MAMKRRWNLAALAIAAALAVAAAAASDVLAVDGNNALGYRGGAQGRVIFDGRTHAAKGLACGACHTKLFPTRKTGLITFADHGSDGKCFACHNGRQTSTCTDCHRSPSN
jgi:c(7)-type cytochrome triheme protein